jgi:hypothetical protein
MRPKEPCSHSAVKAGKKVERPVGLRTPPHIEGKVLKTSRLAGSPRDERQVVRLITSSLPSFSLKAGRCAVPDRASGALFRVKMERDDLEQRALLRRGGAARVFRVGAR